MTTSDVAAHTLTIEGMTCGHCVSSVHDAVSALPGVRSVRVDLGAGTAEVEHHGTFDVTAASAAIADAGYRVTA
ncbi:cation transporter [uncultured Microbacterium sp.]|uniref:cation transporter n=1 Tax=uncultured Microbacterium sp. TaxID=191216 RepID=UPI0025D02650|nr:cation transporter [uncultured Microbacterium sp.]